MGRRWEQGGTIQRRYYHTDALGSVVAISREDGAVTATAEYDPWGKMLASQGMDDYDNTFVGAYGVRRMWDPAGNKYTMGVRHYDAEVGRFLQEDPIYFDINRYLYVSNQPTNRIDPRGLEDMYGNYGGPDWTGGLKEPYDPAHDRYYLPPRDAQDLCYRKHDIGFYWCRKAHPCDCNLRARCFTRCDLLLVGCINQLGNDPSNNSAAKTAAFYFSLKTRDCTDE